jgi:hypothetical protein
MSIHNAVQDFRYSINFVTKGFLCTICKNVMQCILFMAVSLLGCQLVCCILHASNITKKKLFKVIDLKLGFNRAVWKIQFGDSTVMVLILWAGCRLHFHIQFLCYIYHCTKEVFNYGWILIRECIDSAGEIYVLIRH